MKKIFLVFVVLNVAIVTLLVFKKEEQFMLCGNWPNCVSSYETNSSHFVEPIRFGQNFRTTRFQAHTTESFRLLKNEIAKMPGAVCSEEGTEIFKCEFKSGIFGFVDTLLIWPDKIKNLAHIKSSSKTGIWDFGVNRGRVEEIRKIAKQVADYPTLSKETLEALRNLGKTNTLTKTAKAKKILKESKPMESKPVESKTKEETK